MKYSGGVGAKVTQVHPRPRGRQAGSLPTPGPQGGRSRVTYGRLRMAVTPGVEQAKVQVGLMDSLLLHLRL